MDPGHVFSHEYGKRAPKSVCICGHCGDGAKSQHRDGFVKGHGSCKVKECTCKKFSWASYLPLFRAALTKVLKGNRRKA